MNPDAAPEMLLSLLDQLHDWREPPPVSMFPATPAWLVLGAVVLSLLGWGGFVVWRRHRARAYRRAALAELGLIRPALLRGEATALARLELILRRTALAGFRRAEVAALAGADWADFLRRTGGADLAEQVPVLAAATDGGSAPACDGARIARQARDWIRRHHA